MNALLMAPLAVTAGVLSFTSPCCLPLLPGYLAYMTALPDRETAGRPVRLGAAVVFVAGFSAVFTALGVAVGLVGAAVARYVPDLGRVAGLVLIAAGVLMTGLLRPAFTQRELRPGLILATRGHRGAFVLGAAFAAGWSPCIGPVLAAILAVSARTQTAGAGAALLLLYSAGLGIPFLLLAAGADRARWVPFIRRHSVALERAGGVLLIGVGVLLVSGAWDQLLQHVQRTFAGLEWPPI